jgi:hypothetical protein
MDEYRSCQNGGRRKTSKRHSSKSKRHSSKRHSSKRHSSKRGGKNTEKPMDCVNRVLASKGISLDKFERDGRRPLSSKRRQFFDETIKTCFPHMRF